MKTYTTQQIHNLLTITNVIKFTGCAVMVLTTLYNVIKYGFITS